MAFSIENFKSEVFTRGLARENRFRVIMPQYTQGSDLVSLFCESASIPQLSIITKSQRLFGPPTIKASTIDYGGAGLAMTFYVDREMVVKKWFDTWMHDCINSSTFTVNYLHEYARDVLIEQLDERDNITYSIRLVDAFPTSCGPLSLSQSSSDMFHRLPVTFVYRYWETVNVSNSQTPESTIAGPQEGTKSWGKTIPKPKQLEKPFVITGEANQQAPGGTINSLGAAP